MATVTELRNEAQEALTLATAILEERAEAKDDEARDNAMSRYKRAWKDYENKKELLRAAEAAEAEQKEFATPANEAPRPSDTRNPKDADWIPSVTAEKANEVPDGYVKIADGIFVPYASEKTEGYVRKFPVAVQHPSIMQRYGKEMRDAKSVQEDAFMAYVRRGYNWISRNRPELLKPLAALQEGDDSEGGYLVPSDQRMELIFDPGAPGGIIRPESRQFTTTRDGGTWPTMSGGGWAAIAEEAAGGEDDESFGQVPFTIHKTGRNLKLSEEFLSDEAANVVAAINGNFMRSAGRYEDQQAIEGDGSNEPLGLRTTGAPQGDVGDITDLLTKAGVTVAEVINAWAELPAQFRQDAIWYTTSSFFGTLCAIESTNGGVSFLRELTQSPTRTLMGNRIVMFDGTGWDSGALSITGDAEVGAFGDFRNFYYFIDRVGMSVRRDDSRYADTDQVLFKARKRYDSLYAENNAFRILKAAS